MNIDRVINYTNYMSSYRSKNSSKAQSIKASGENNRLELAEKHDITDMTYDEFKDLSQSLYEKGKITLLDHAIMTFNPQKSPQNTVIKDNYYLTEETHDGKRNWLNEFTARYQRAQNLNNTQGSKHYKRILDILTDL